MVESVIPLSPSGSVVFLFKHLTTYPENDIIDVEIADIKYKIPLQNWKLIETYEVDESSNCYIIKINSGRFTVKYNDYIRECLQQHDNKYVCYVVLNMKDKEHLELLHKLFE